MMEYGRKHTDGSRSGGQPVAEVMKNDVPEWALQRAVELAGFPVQVDDENKPLPWRQSLYNAGLDAFARYIAAYEQPPLDPLREALDDCWHLMTGPRGKAIDALTTELRARLPGIDDLARTVAATKNA